MVLVCDELSKSLILMFLSDFSIVYRIVLQTEESSEFTYIGREQIEIAGKSVEACKVDRVVFKNVGDPSFNTSSISTIWHGVGTGLTLKIDAVSLPFSDLDRLTEITILEGASINSIQIF